MAGFIYNNKSTKNIVSDELVLVSAEGAVEEVTGMEREFVEGEPTINRPIVNEYGSNTNHLEFTYSLIKAGGEDFTENEQRAVERWLTSPKFSSKLTLYDCDGVERLHYYGKFKSTSWLVSAGTYVGVTFTFTVNGSYAYEHHVFEASPSDPTEEWTFTLDCETDELEEYVYPKITISRYNFDFNVSFIMENVTDKGNTLKVTTSRKDEFYIDCQHNILTEQSGVVKFKELGWADVGNIYWPRLIAGTNVFRVQGAIKVKFEYDSPVKLVGGWLI